MNALATKRGLEMLFTNSSDSKRVEIFQRNLEMNPKLELKSCNLIAKRIMLKLNTEAKAFKPSLFTDANALVESLDALISSLRTRKLVAKICSSETPKLLNSRFNALKFDNIHENINECIEVMRIVQSELDQVYAILEFGDGGPSSANSASICLPQSSNGAQGSVDLLPTKLFETFLNTSSEKSLSAEFGELFGAFGSSDASQDKSTEASLCNSGAQKVEHEVILQYMDRSIKRRIEIDLKLGLSQLKDIFAKQFGHSIEHKGVFMISHSTTGHMYEMEDLKDVSSGCKIKYKLSKNVNSIDSRSILKLQLIHLQSMRAELDQLQSFMKEQLSELTCCIDFVHQHVASTTKTQRLLPRNFKECEISGIILMLSQFSHFLETTRTDLTRGYPKPHQFTAKLIKDTQQSLDKRIERVSRSLDSQIDSFNVSWKESLEAIMVEKEYVQQAQIQMQSILKRQHLVSELASSIIPVLDHKRSQDKEPKDHSRFDNVYTTEQVKELGKKDLMLELQLAAKKGYQNNASYKLDLMVETMKTFKIAGPNAFQMELFDRVENLNPAKSCQQLDLETEQKRQKVFDLLFNKK
jgi:hypothetical protein